MISTRTFLLSIIFGALIVFPSCISSQTLGHPLLYEQDFEGLRELDAFMMTDASAWRIKDTLDNKALELFGKSDYSPRVRSPFNIACISTHRFDDFVLEFNAAQTGKEYGHRDMCFFFGMKDPANFYYVHIATKADPHAHNIFLVNDEPRVAIAEKTTDGIDWGKPGSWHKIKIIRKIETGLIQVYFDDMENPIMETHDTHFEGGYIGFGSFDDTGMVDNIKIWGETSLEKSKGFFPN